MSKTSSFIFLLVILLEFADGSLGVTVTKELTNDGFTFSCVLSPGPFTTFVIFSNPAGTIIGGCTVPVNPTTSGLCNSATSPASTVTQDMTTSTTTIAIPAGYITGTTGLIGDWKCTHGSDEATVTYSNILAFNQDGLSFTSHTSGELLPEGLTSIAFRMDCLYPSATYEIGYLDNNDGNKVIYTQMLLSSACTNVAASCTTVDSNAFGQDCTFSVNESKLASKTKIQVKAKVTGMQTTNYPTIVSNFIIKRFFEYGVYHTCPTDKNTWEFGNSCIQVHFNELDWDDARAYCRRLGGDLLEVRSSDMQLFLQRHLIATGRRPAGYWIGATDRDHEDNWQWLHGDKAMHFSNWEKGQGPGQSGFFFSDGSLEDCAMIRPDAGYKWHDGPCAGGFAFHYAFLCEFQIVRVSAATTKPTASILMSTLKPTKLTQSLSTKMPTADLKASSSKSPSTDSSKPTKSITKVASATSMVTPKPTKSISTRTSATSVVTPKPTKSITTTASATSVVTPKPTKSITKTSATSVVTSTATTSSRPLSTVTSAPSSPVTSTEVPTSTAMPITTTTATGVIIGG